MYQQKQKIQNVTLMIVDAFCLIASYYLAAYLKMGIIEHMGKRSFRYANESIWAIFLTYCAVFLFFNMNQYLIEREKFEEFIYVLKVNIVMSMVLTALLFVSKTSVLMSRTVWGVMIVTNIVLMYLAHRLVRTFILKRAGTKYKTQLYLVTTRDELQKTVEQLTSNNEWAKCDIKAALVDCKSKEQIVSGIKIAADPENVYEFAKRNVVDEVFLNLPSTEEEELKKYIQKFESMGITVHVNMHILQGTEGFQRQINMVGDFPVVSFAPRFFDYNKLAAKRLMDIAGALVGLFITGVITIFVAPALLIESPGPLIFKQKRVGKNGRFFYIYKFRSMYKDAEERKKQLMEQNEMKGLMFKMTNDPRITKVGKFIRDTSIDELPQFWNVLKGDMSLVGTRPPTVDEFNEYSSHHKRRLSMKPGMTGMWQVSGRSNIEDFEEVVKLDVEYIDKWSLALDIKILIKTVLVVLGKVGSK